MSTDTKHAAVSEDVRKLARLAQNYILLNGSAFAGFAFDRYAQLLADALRDREQIAIIKLRAPAKHLNISNPPQPDNLMTTVALGEQAAEREMNEKPMKEKFKFRVGDEYPANSYCMSYECTNCGEGGSVWIRKGIKKEDFNLPCPHCEVAGEIIMW